MPLGDLQRVSPPIIQASIVKIKTPDIPSELSGHNLKLEQWDGYIHRIEARVQKGEAKKEEPRQGCCDDRAAKSCLRASNPRRSCEPVQSTRKNRERRDG